MKLEIIEITKEWGVRIVLCTNAEVLEVDDEGLGLTQTEMVCSAVTKAQDVVFDKLGAFAEEDGFFQNWEGGKFSCYDEIYASLWHRNIELDEDGDEEFSEWEWFATLSKPEGVPAELVTKIQAVVDEAAKARGKAFDEFEYQRVYALIDNEVSEFNEQWEDYEEITADPTVCVEENADEIYELQSQAVHFRIGSKEYEITYDQDHHGKYSAHLHEYKVEDD